MTLVANEPTHHPKHFMWISLTLLLSAQQTWWDCLHFTNEGAETRKPETLPKVTEAGRVGCTKLR